MTRKPRLTGLKSAGAWVALIVIIAVLGGTHHEFFDVSNIRNVLSTNAELLVVAAGMTVVVIDHPRRTAFASARIAVARR